MFWNRNEGAVRVRRARVFFLFFGALGLLLAGCATFTQGTRQVVSIETDPPGAEVYRGGELLGTTPLEHAFSRKVAHRLVIRKEGYEDEEVLLYTVDNEAADQFIRFSVEQRRGSYQSLEPEEVSLTLTPNP